MNFYTFQKPELSINIIRPKEPLIRKYLYYWRHFFEGPRKIWVKSRLRNLKKKKGNNQQENFLVWGITSGTSWPRALLNKRITYMETLCGFGVCLCDWNIIPTLKQLPCLLALSLHLLPSPFSCSPHTGICATTQNCPDRQGEKMLTCFVHWLFRHPHGDHHNNL